MKMEMKMKMKKFAVAGVLSLSLLALGGMGGYLSANGYWGRLAGRLYPPQVDQAAPDFTLKDLQGRSVSLSDYAGKPVLLNFWASWCPACRQEAPELQAFHARYGEQITVLGVNWGETPQTVEGFLREFGITFPNVLDPRGQVFYRYRLTGVPTSFFIDEEGIIRGVWLGAINRAELRAAFKRFTGWQEPPR